MDCEEGWMDGWLYGSRAATAPVCMVARATRTEATIKANADRLGYAFDTPELRRQTSILLLAGFATVSRLLLSPSPPLLSPK